MSRPVKYRVLAVGLLVATSSIVLVLGQHFGGMMAHGCMQMMQGMQPGSSQRPNEQWRRQR